LRPAIFTVEIHEANNGEELVKKAQELNPVLIVTDNQMPKMTGLAAVSRIKSFLPNVKAVLFTNDNVQFDGIVVNKSGTNAIDLLIQAVQSSLP